jgi:hypothetical protein
MSIAAYQRQKAAAKLRRLSAYERARGPSAGGAGGGAGARTLHGSQNVPAAALAHLLDAEAGTSKEYFSGERFKQSVQMRGQDGRSKRRCPLLTLMSCCRCV